MSTATLTPRNQDAPKQSSPFVRGLGHFFKARETGILIAVLLVIVVTTVKNPSFVFSSDGWRDLLLTPSILVLVAVGQAIVIITKSVDLSVGSVLGLTAYLTGRLFIDIPGIPMIVVFLAGIVFGGLLGLINGALVAFAKVPAMVITLGTLYAYRGINVVWAGSDRINASDMPKDFLALGTGQFLSIPLLTIIALVVLVAAAWYMKNTRGGREFYAIGSDPAAAGLYGLRVVRRLLIAFVASGALAGLAGVLYAYYRPGLKWDMGAQILLLVFAAVTLGGLGTAFGALVGAIVVGILVEISSLWIPADLKYVGALVVLILILLFRPQGILGRRERIG